MSKTTGYSFISDEFPLNRLPSYFDDWEALLEDLPEKIRSKTLREAVHQLPQLEFSECTLKSEREWQRAYLVLSFLGQGYVRMIFTESTVTLPKKIAIPWASVSKHLKLKPNFSYAACVLYNYGVKDDSLPKDNLSNLYAMHTFTGSSDEAHFYMIHMLIEILLQPAVQATGQVHDLMAMKDDEKIMECLKTVKMSVVKFQDALQKMHGCCNKTFFYNEIRPFFSKKTEKIVYEGVEDCSFLRGGSGAQSTSVHALNILFGIKLSEKSKPYILDMMNYMPEAHRDFLVKLREQSSFRDYCLTSGNSVLVRLFNEAVEEFVRLRSQHIILMTRYDVSQGKSDEDRAHNEEAITMLKDMRDKTMEAKIHLQK